MSSKLHGFLEEHQAIKRKRGQTIKEISIKIFKSIIGDPNLGTQTKGFFINSFMESKSFDETKVKIDALEDIGEISKRQAKKLWRAYNMNDQVRNYGGVWRMKSYFSEFEKN